MSEASEPASKKLSLTAWIIIGLLAGVTCGLFFGDYNASLKWIGDAYVGLLQMAVLPYVAVSLICNIGSLSVSAGIRLLRVSVAVLLLLWLVGLIALVVISQSFPDWETGSFYSTQLTEQSPSQNWIDLFIPSNPFRSLSDNAIPAVVVFCIGLGISLMTMPDKDRLLKPLDVMVEALANLNRLVIRLTPIGMFGIAAYTTGTIEFDQFSLIQGYLLTYGVAAAISSFVVLPALIASFTNWTFREISAATRDPLVAAFVIGNTFVVLPMIIEAIQKLNQTDSDAGSEEQQADYLVPLCYPFPDLGRIVGIVFIPFAAWFYGQSVDPDMIPSILGVGVIGSFAKAVITIPLLLDIAELPGDIFNLFLASGVIAARFGDLMKTMHIIAFTILTMSFLNGQARIRPAKLLACLVGGFGVLLVTSLLIKGYLNREFKEQFSRESLLTERTMNFRDLEQQVANTEITILQEAGPNPWPLQEGESRVERIRRVGFLRVGFNPGRLPFCYFNNQGELTGFDMQMAYYLAYDLGVGIQFVPILEDQLFDQLQKDHFDIAMAALEGTVAQAAQLPSSDPYMETTLSIVVPDYNKKQFASLETMLESAPLRLAVIKNSYFAERAHNTLFDTIEVVELDSAREYFEGRFEEVDGLVISAESGAAWTLRWPLFTVTNPVQGKVRVPLYYLTANDPVFNRFVQNWMVLKKSNGTWQDLYDYWILGKDERQKQRRWCILRDVLGWVE